MNQIIELKTGELFSGAGGLGLGFVLAEHPLIRFQPIFAIDSDAHSLDTYKYNMAWLAQNASAALPRMPGIFQRDVELLKVSAILRLFKLKRGELDLLIGGPPCQGFSSSNRKGTNKHNTNRLVNVFLDKLSEFKPKMFLMENVQGLRWTKLTEDMSVPLVQETLFPEFEKEPDNVRDFLIMKAISLGYHVWFDVLDAVDFGVPQHRLRFFLFGIRSELVSNKNDVDLRPYLEVLKFKKKVSVIAAIRDLPRLENGQSWTGDNYQPSNEEYVRKMRRYMLNGDLYDHFTTKHADYVIERYKQIPEGENWQTIRNQMTNYKKVENTHSNIYRRLNGNEPANTISQYRKSMIIHPSQHRGISFREACRLQSFPDWFRFVGTNDERQQQLGNAVPPLMAATVAKAIGELWLKVVFSKVTAAPPPNLLSFNPSLLEALQQ